MKHSFSEWLCPFGFCKALLRRSKHTFDRPILTNHNAPPSLRSGVAAKQSRKITGLPRTKGARNDEVIDGTSKNNPGHFSSNPSTLSPLCHPEFISGSLQTVDSLLHEIPKQVRDDTKRRRYGDDTPTPRHPEFISGSFRTWDSLLHEIPKQVRDDSSRGVQDDTRRQWDGLREYGKPVKIRSVRKHAYPPSSWFLVPSSCKRNALAFVCLLLSISSVHAQEDPIIIYKRTPKLLESPPPIGQVQHSVSTIRLMQGFEHDTTHILQTVPGVHIITSGGPGAAEQHIKLRGSESNHVYVELDGMELNNTRQSGGVDFSLLPPEILTNMHIVKGSQSTAYGSEAMGGAIRLLSGHRMSKNKPFFIEALSEHGSYASHKYHTGLFYHKGKMQNNTYLTFHHTNGVATTPKNQGGHENDAILYKHIYNKNEIFFSEQHRLETNLRFMKANQEFDTPPFLPEPESESKTVQKDVKIEYNYLSFNEKLKTKLKYQNSSDAANIDDRLFGAFQSESHKNKLVGDITYELSDRQQLQALTEYKRDGLKTPKNAFQQYAFGAGWSHKDFGIDHLNLATNIRHDWHDRFQNAVSYRIGAEYPFHKLYKLHTHYAKGTQNPTLVERFGFGTFFLPNPDIKPERKHGFDIGLTYYKYGEMDLTYFREYYHDMISFDMTHAFNREDKIINQGIEYSAKIPLSLVSQQDQIALSYTYIHTQARTPLLRQPQHSVSVEYTSQFTNPDVGMLIGYYTASRRHDIGDTLLQPYHRLYGSLSHQFSKDCLVYLRAENIFAVPIEEIKGQVQEHRLIYIGIKFIY